MSTQLGATVTMGAIGPSGFPTIGYSNLFAVIQSPWGEAGKWAMCSSFTDYLRQFGGLNHLTTLAADGADDTWTAETDDDVIQGYYAIKAFFEERGTASNGVAYLVRVVQSADGYLAPVSAASRNFPDAGVNNTVIASKWKGTPGSTTEVKITNPSPLGAGIVRFELRNTKATITETWEIANVNDAATATKNSKLATITLPAGAQLPITVASWQKLGNGTPAVADPYAATTTDLVGATSSAGAKTGIQAFNDYRLGTGFLAIPGQNDATIRSGAKVHAEAYKRFYLIGSPAAKDKSNIAAVVTGTTSNDIGFYGPRVWVADQMSTTGGMLLVDPVGHIAGLGAKMDAEYQGPHKSPAGTTHQLSTVLDVERASNGLELYDDAACNTLADSNVNIIRCKGGGFTVWGLRTLAVDLRYQQINSARVVELVYLTALLMGEKYAFEPIDPDGKLFGKARGEFGGFLSELYRHGALYGTKPGATPKTTDAYQVVCDNGNNTSITIGQGELHIDLAIVPTKNAESVKIALNVAQPGFVTGAVA